MQYVLWLECSWQKIHYFQKDTIHSYILKQIDAWSMNDRNPTFKFVDSVFILLCIITLIFCLFAFIYAIKEVLLPR